MYVAGEGATVIEGGGGEEGVWISYGYPQCRSCVASGSGARHCWCSRTPPSRDVLDDDSRAARASVSRDVSL